MNGNMYRIAQKTEKKKLGIRMKNSPERSRQGTALYSADQHTDKCDEDNDRPDVFLRNCFRTAPFSGRDRCSEKANIIPVMSIIPDNLLILYYVSAIMRIS